MDRKEAKIISNNPHHLIYQTLMHQNPFSQALYISFKTVGIAMAHDEEHFRRVRRFSAVQQCPRCNELALSFENGALRCSKCGYQENVPSMR